MEVGLIVIKYSVMRNASSIETAIRVGARTVVITVQVGKHMGLLLCVIHGNHQHYDERHCVLQ